MVHLFHRAEKWHCFYYTYKEMEPVGKNQWKYGPHLHFVNYLWPNFSKKQVWAAFDKREHNIDGIHIKLETMLEPDPSSSKEFGVLALAFIKRYKNVTIPLPSGIMSNNTLQ